jgi:hypothetical protein
MGNVYRYSFFFKKKKVYMILVGSVVIIVMDMWLAVFCTVFSPLSEQVKCGVMIIIILTFLSILIEPGGWEKNSLLRVFFIGLLLVG